MKIEFDASDLLDQADSLAKIDASALQTIRQDTVNVVALMVRDKAIRQTHTELNLTRDYIESKITRDEAKRGSARARLLSPIEGATLQRFGARQATKPVKYTNSDILNLAGATSFSAGAVVGPKGRLKSGKVSNVWTERTGDASRGIDANRKAAGIAVNVNRKGEKTIKTAFTRPLLNNNGFGVFRRENGNLKHLYGPSVYQTFRRYIALNEQEITNTMQDEFVQRLDSEIKKAYA